MATCEFDSEFSSLLESYHDGELDARSVERLEAHVQGCAACQQSLQAMRAISDLIQSAPTISMSNDMVARLHGEVDRTMERSLLPLARSLVGIAAAVLIVASAGLWTLHPAPVVAPQAWEGASLTPQTQAELSQPSSLSSVIEPEVVVADLSRRSLR